jgi:hypothetical protein
MEILFALLGFTSQMIIIWFILPKHNENNYTILNSNLTNH